MRYLLPIYLVLYVAAAFVWRTYMVWKRTGVNPVTFKKTDSAHDFIGLLFKLLFALIFVVVFGHAFFPDFYRFSLPIDWLDKQWIEWFGLFLLALSLGWTVVAQAQMGESWRIGIDQENATPLVSTGVFQISRNPIYVGMILTLMGLFCVIPNGLTLLALVLGVVLMGIQVRLEEEFLAHMHGEAYMEFQARVNRWFGRRAR